MSVELTEALLSTAAGWEAMKRARAYLEQGEVLSSYWSPPLLRGVVQAGDVSFRASMVIKGEIDIENLCTCREAREWGKICAHGVAVGLHWLKAQKPATVPAAARSAVGGVQTRIPAKQASALQRDTAGEPAELFIILPPNVDQAIARGKVMLVFEAKWSGGRCPLSALPKGRSFAFSPQDNAIIEQLETLTNGETPALLQMETKDFAALLPALAEHPNITLGKANEVTVTKTPLKLPLRAMLEANGEIVAAEVVERQVGDPLFAHRPGQQAGVHGRVVDDANLVIEAERQNLRLDRAVDHRVGRLERSDRGDLHAALHLGYGEVRDADVTDLALMFQPHHGRPALFDVLVLHRPVDLVEVDRLHLEAAQALFHLAADLQQGAFDLALLVPHHAALGEDKGLDVGLFHRLADHLFGVAKAIDGGGVDPVDPQVDGLVNRRDGGIIVLRPPGHRPIAAAQGPRSETDRGEPHVRDSKLTDFHRLSWPCRLPVKAAGQTPLTATLCRSEEHTS